MSAFDGIFEHFWAIEPSWLPKLAALAQRHQSAPVLRDVQPWERRDYPQLAGPSARKLEGGHRATIVDGVAVVPIMGPIFPRANVMTEMCGATSCSMATLDLNAAVRSGDVGAILLMIDSPGGAVGGVSALADYVEAVSARKATMAFVAGSACSAAYWIASAASEIAIDRTGLVGSIGVVVGAAKQVAPDSDGYLSIEIVSSNAPNKRPDPTTTDGIGEIRSTLDALETLFVADVARRRKVTPDKVKSGFGRGGVKVGEEAKKAGMVDRVQSLDWTMQGLRRVAKDAIERRKMSFAK